MAVLSRLCRILLLAACALAPMSWIAATPLIGAGLWQQSEGCSLWLDVVSAIAACALGLLACLGDRRAVAAALHPVPLTLAAIGFWSILVAPLLSDPLLSLQGFPVNPVGGIWHLEVAVLAAAAICLSGPLHARWLAACLVIPIVLVLVTDILPLVHHESVVWAPYDWLEYLGPWGLFAGTALFALGLAGRGALSLRFVAVALFLACTVCSFSKTAMLVAGCFALILFPAVRWYLGVVDRRRLVVAALGLAAVLALGVALAGGPLERIAAGSAHGDDGVASVVPADHVDMYARPYGTIWSRSMMWRVAVKDVVAHPAAYILGRGWGNFPSMEETWTREVGGRLYDTRWPGAGLTVWDARTKAFFHPHNMFLDAFLSAGPLGAALWLYLVLTPLLFARHRARLPAVALSLGLVVYGSLWFLVNSSAGLLALALAVTTSPAAGEVVRQRVAYGRAAAMLALLAAGGLFTTSAMSAMSSLPEETWLRHTITTQGPPPVAAIDDCSPVGGFLHPRRQITTKLYGVLAASVAGAPDRAAEMQRLAPEVARITCATRAVLRKDPDAWSLVVQASARTGLFYIFAPEPRIVGGLMKPELLSWDDDLDRLLAIAPERTDLVAYRFEWAMATHRYQDARIIASEAQRIMDPGDPVALLIAGHVDWLNGGKEASALLSKAFRRGIDDLIEVNTNMVVSPAQVGR